MAEHSTEQTEQGGEERLEDATATMAEVGLSTATADTSCTELEVRGPPKSVTERYYTKYFALGECKSLIRSAPQHHVSVCTPH